VPVPRKVIKSTKVEPDKYKLRQHRKHPDTIVKKQLDFPEFPKPKFKLWDNPDKFLQDKYDELKNRLNTFKYDARMNSNTLKQDYELFLDDTDTFLSYFREIIVDISDAIRYYNDMQSHAKALYRISLQYDAINKEYNEYLQDKNIDILDPLSTAKAIEKDVQQQEHEVQRRKQLLEKVEQEIAITTDMLAKKKSEMEEALEHRYTLTPMQKQVLLEEKDKILDGIEKWGSVYGALSHDQSIKSAQSTIQSYMQLFPEFGQAVQISKALFKDRLDGMMIERAIEGTENPVFSKGEYIGDYRIKDNKMFMELMKAKVPEEYNKKSVEVNKGIVTDNVNIISFANVDETKQGFTKDVGVVIDVDNTGKVSRVLQDNRPVNDIRKEEQEKKMLEYYSKKAGAEIIEPEKGDQDGLQR